MNQEASHDPKFGEVLAIPLGVKGHQSIGAKQSVRGDNEIDKETYWRVACRTPSPLRIGCKAFRSLPPDAFFKVKFNDDASFREEILYKALGCFGMRKQFCKNRGAYNQSSLRMCFRELHCNPPSERFCRPQS